MKNSQLKAIISECVLELLSESIKSPKDFKVTIEKIDPETKEWTGYGLIKIPFLGWKSINRGTRKQQFTWSVKGKVYNVDISDYLKTVSIKETVNDIDYTPEITNSNPSISSLIKQYSGDYSNFVDRGSAKFLDFGDHFSFSFLLVFPKTKVDVKSIEEIYKIVKKKLSFFKQEEKIYGKGTVSVVDDNDESYILKFNVRGGK